MAEFCYDGYDVIRGVWGGNATAVPKLYAQNAVNRFFREDRNTTRPQIRTIRLQFESEAQQTFFEAANGQGATFYNTYPSYVSPYVVASLGGRVFKIQIQGTTGIVTQLYDGNSRQFMHAWFGQGFNWLAVQDGIHPPILWDGQNAARRSDIAKGEVPIGSVMAFIHGRFVVASADGLNNVFVGDIVYGDGVTTPNNIINFLERTYWAEGGNFNTPAFLGNIMGLYPMPFLDTGTGQNELVIGCTGGFGSLDLSAPREQWIDNQVQKVALIGDGLVSSHGFDGLNGDMFFRSQSGINTYRNARIEYAQHWNQTPVSREVNYWLKPDRKDLLEFIPQVSFQNMVLTGVSPILVPPNNPNLGYHHPCRGMVVYDADAMSTTGRDGDPVWHGMWSGIRPWAFAKGIIQNSERCFSFSFDRDGRNRLYEITLQPGNDLFETTQRLTQSFYITGEMGTVEARTNAFAPKKLNGGVIEYSGLVGVASFTVDYKADGSPCWINVQNGEPGCECAEKPECNINAAPQWGRAYFRQVPTDQCVPGTSQPAGVFHHCQIKVGMVGQMTVNRLNIRMDLMPDGQTSTCIEPNCQPINCCPAADDYAYHIAPAGTNTNVPDVPPDPNATLYTSTRIYRAECPGNPNVSVTAYGQGSGVVSQKDADEKAQAAAQQNATDQLVCPACTPVVLDDFIINGGVENLAGFFTSGRYEGAQGQPWRLFNVTLQQYIASGTVNNSGTLNTVNTFPQYTQGSFDPATNIYTDNGGGNTRISLELGCSSGAGISWPFASGYGQLS